MTDRIERSIDVAAPIARVWRALTDHEQFGTWFRVALDGPFRVGEDTTGAMTYPGHEGTPWRSTTVIMDAPHRFSFRWPHGDAEDAPETLVEFSLAEVDGGTLLTVVESGFDALPPDRRTSVMRDNGEGWAIQTGNVKAHVEQPGPR